MAADDSTQMAADEERRVLNELTSRVIGAAHRVSSVLGTGFLEKVYENALCLELRSRGLQVRQQQPVHVRYEGAIVGDYVSDIVVDDRLLVELKAQKGLDPIHRMQCIHYLRATGMRICLLINFGRPRIEVFRLVNHF